MSSTTPLLPPLVAICGAKRSGKDTIAVHLATHYGYQILKIATPLKMTVQNLFSFSDEQMETDLKDEVDPRWGTSPRALMQYIGTDVFQFGLQQVIPGLGRRFWVDKLIHDIDTSKRYVVSDVRFLHEIHALKSRFPDTQTLVIRVDRSPSPCNASASDDDGGSGQDGPCHAETHCSEREYLRITPDFIINNRGTLHELYDRVDACVIGGVNDDPSL